MPFDAPGSALGLKTIFGTILKVEDQEDGTIKVYGVASSETRDVAGEIVRASAMEDALPDYSRFPALREMHQPLAAGKVLEAEVDGDGVTQIVAHVVDPVAIVKVRTGVYGGFSIGGKVLKRDPSDRSIITALRLVEISLVDSPCNPDAVLTMWKADLMKIENPTSAEVIARAKELAKAAGTKRYRDFLFDAREAIVSERTLEAVEKGEIELEPAAEIEAVAEVEESAVAEVVEEPAAAVTPVAEAPAVLEEPIAEVVEETIEAAAQPETEAAPAAEEPVATEAAKEEGKEATAAVDPAAALSAAIEKGQDALEAAAPEAPEDPFADLEKAGNALKQITGYDAEKAGGIDFFTNEKIQKSMYEVSRFADLLCSFSHVQRCLACEAEQEGDGSTIPAELATAINGLGDLLVRLAQEEVAELVASLKVPESDTEVEIIYVGDDFYLAEAIVDLVKADTDLMEKAGSRHSKADAEHLQGAHDHLAKMGATCDKANCAKDDGDSMEAAAASERITALETENEGLKKVLEESAPKVEKLVAAFQEQIDELRKRFEDEPLPPKTAGPAATRAIEKGQDSAGIGAGSQEAPLDAVTMTDEQLDKYWNELSEAERGHILMKAALHQPRLISGKTGPSSTAA